jgi:ATP-dependent Clp protease ATP-binding subunit ClpC
MNLSNFNLTPSAKKAISDSAPIAKDFGHLKVIDLHLTLSILRLTHSSIDFAFSSNNLIKDGVAESIEHAIMSYKEPKRKKAILAQEIYEILENSQKLASIFKDEFIGIDHILVSIFSTRVEIADFLVHLDVDLPKLIDDLKKIIKDGIPKEKVTSVIGLNDKQQEYPSPEMNAWCENLNEKIAEKNEFEIFGRDEEIERIFEVLLRRNKSNVILVGEAGVGKTAIVEGMAEKIIKRECPDLLLHKEILCLDLTSVLAGTIYRGQMEEKLKKILDHLSKEDQYILFIDEIHTIVGAGSSEGSLDLANILKPALSRGNISCVGATTKDEYNRFFKKDSALNRRFEKIDVSEPTKEETFQLLKTAKKSYEKFHQVRYTDELLEKTVDLCDVYLSDKKFPDKAFDILDESGAKTKKTNIVRPQKAKDMEAKLSDQDFQQTTEYDKLHSKYSKIIEKWGKNLKNKIFDVDIETVYGIFASKLNTSKENIKENKNVPSSGRIGF